MSTKHAKRQGKALFMGSLAAAALAAGIVVTTIGISPTASSDSRAPAAEPGISSSIPSVTVSPGALAGPPAQVRGEAVAAPVETAQRPGAAPETLDVATSNEAEERLLLELGPDKYADLLAFARNLEEQESGSVPRLGGAFIERVEQYGDNVTVYARLDSGFLADGINDAELERIDEAAADWAREDGHDIAETAMPVRVLVASSDSSSGYAPIESFLQAPPATISKDERDQFAEAAPSNDSGRQATALAGVAPHGGQGQPSGPLAGKSIFLSPGHGWYNSGGSWITQRTVTNGIIEDHANAEWVDNWVRRYIWNAGGSVYTVRERDMNSNQVTVDNAGSGYSETGSWWTVSDGHNGSMRVASGTTGSETARATFTPNIPAAGYYGVYVHYQPSGSSSSSARYIVNHTGGSTEYVQNMNRDGYTWKYIGTFWFDAGSNPGTGSVALSNSSSSGGNVIADAVRFGGGIGQSGHPRFEESGLYYAGEMGKSNWASYNTVSAMPSYAAWENESWEDSIYVSLHSDAGGGSSRGTIGITFGTCWDCWDDNTYAGYPGSRDLREAVRLEVVNDIRAAWDSSWVSRYPVSRAYGEINTSYNNEMPSIILELGFHTNVTDAAAMRDPRFRDLAARSVYKGIVKYFADRDNQPVNLLPEPPVNFVAKLDSSGNVVLDWNAGLSGGIYGDAATGYKIYTSTHGKGFDNGTVASSAPYTMSGLSANTTYYFRVAATNAGGESFPTETLAVRTKSSGTNDVLFVNGYDRLDSYLDVQEGSVSRMFVDKMNTSDYVIQHGDAIVAAGESFDSASAQAVADGDINLANYDLVVWAAGQQAAVTPSGPTTRASFTADMRTAVQSFLNGGGSLFLSGSEFAWDLDRDADQGDAESLFVQNYLKSSYVDDDVYTGSGSPSNTAAGTSGSIFDGISLSFDNGNDGTYFVNYPDVIDPSGGSSVAMTYTGSSEGNVNAAVEYDGGDFKVVSMAFPFETIIGASTRNAVMAAAIDFLIDDAAPPADTGFVVNFDGYSPGSEVAFRYPGWSGSTNGIEAGSSAAVSTTQANNRLDPAYGSTGTQSYRYDFEWSAAGSGFVRSTSYNVATKPNPRINLTKGLSVYVKVVQGEVDMGLWLRETGSAGTIGDNGGTSGVVEELTSLKRLSASSEWQYVYFDLPNETYTAVNGNGQLDGWWGTLEALTFHAVPGSQATVVELYVDDIHNGGQHTPIAIDYPPAAPTGLAATAGDGEVALDWADNGEGDLDGYNVYRATSTGGPYTKLNGSLVSSSAYNDASAVNFTTYYYVVTAVDAADQESASSGEVSATPEDTTAPAAPAGLAASAGDGQVGLDWSDNGEGDLAGYNVYRASSSGGPYTKLNGSLVAASAYNDNSVANFSTYYYVVTAVDNTPNANESAQSAQVSATPQDTTPPAAPVGLAATADDGEVTLDWADNGEGDLAGYNVYRAAASGGPYAKLNGGLVGSSAYTDTSVTNFTTYYYVVTAVDNTPNANESAQSAQVSATPEDTTPPAAPVGLAATEDDGEVALDWADSGEGDLDGYNVYRATSSGGPYTKLNGSVIAASAYTDASVTNFTTYYYVVTAVDNTPNANESAQSAQVSATPEDTTAPDAPSGLAATAGSSSIDLDWTDNGESDLDGYNVYRATASGGPYSKLNGALVSSSAYSDTSAQESTTYYYVVTAVDDTPNENESGYSNEASAEIVPPNAPVVVWEGHASDSIVAYREPAWSGSTNGVNTSTDAAGVSTAEANDILDPSAGSASTQSYRFFFQWNTAGSGFVRATSYYAPTKPNPRINLTQGVAMYVKVAQGEVDLGMWIRETGSAGEIGGDGGTSGTVEELTSRRRLSAAPNWQYVYFDLPSESYQAVNGNGTLEGQWGTLEAITFSAVPGSPATTIEVFVDDIYNGVDHTPLDPAPAVPAGLAATAGDEQVTLDWADNGESDLDGYNLYRATTSGGPYTKLNGSPLSSSAYTDNAVVNFTDYYYTVTAVDTAANESAQAGQVSATPEDTTAPAVPVGLVATAGQTAIDLNWNDNTEFDLDGYHVYRATSSGGPYTRLTGSPVAVSAYSDLSAQAYVTYYYAVSAVDDTPNANESAKSAEDSAVIVPPNWLVLDWEGYTAGSLVGFREPAWSGSTNGIYTSNDVAEVSTAEANDILDPNVGFSGSQSYRYYFQLVSAGSGFVRSTSYAAPEVPNPRIDLREGLSIYVKVVQGEIDLGLWIRETGSSGTIGGNGGTSGTIEELTSRERLSSSSDWQYVYFDLPNESYQAVTGNGTLDGSWGTLEAITFSAVPGSPATIIEVYVDDIYNGAQHPAAD